MSNRTVQVAVAIAACLALHADLHAQTKKRPAPARRAPAAPTLECGDLVGFQVLLDRQAFSPGEIDGRTGANFSHVLAALQTARKLQPTGQPDCDTWKALGGDSAEPTITTYTLTDEDVKGPFEKIPPKLAEQSHLDALGYQSTTELIAERFHSSPALLARLNPGVAMTAGNTIKVPAVTAFDAAAKPARDAEAGDITIQVSREESALRATRADGTLVFFAPVSSGSTHDPLPPGDWKVNGVSWHPTFHYNPDLFWDAKATDEKALIKAGPNNPVGVVWVALNLEHYGIHGTPEPGHIGHTESHGCVRMTNWDAAHLASLVKPGTPVTFK
ncbi:MAG TPA: L,D-transpeptidase [Vicinamibacterales bacterium]|nr:L,D-transpeptidase [Vicinamibacterales bacterium]